MTEVASCPDFAPEPQRGCLVTGTFKHRNRDIMRLTFVGPGGTRQEFHRVDDQIVAAYDETGDLDWQAIWGPRIDQLLEWRDRDGSSDYIAMLDHRNSVVGTWDSMSGELDAIADHTADGRVTSRNAREEPTCVEEGNFHVQCDGPSGMPFGFNARWRSDVTGLTNMRARWYSARHGQFTSHDPLGYIDTQNLYAFAAFDPINGWDPYGLSKSQQTENPGIPGLTVPWTYTPSTDKYYEAGRNEDVAGALLGVGPMMAEQVLVPVINLPHNLLLTVKRTVQTGTAVGMGRPEQAADHAEEAAAAGANAALGYVELYGFRSMLTGPPPGSSSRLSPLSKKKKTAADSPDVAKDAARGPCTGAACKSVCSFTATTRVLMCDGSRKKISEVEEGEWVLTRDEETGDIECQQVVQPYSNSERSIIEVTLLDDSGNLETLETTFNHPFFVEGQGWTQVDALREGDVVPSPSGRLQVVAVEWTGQYETVYNFGVEGTRSYFVGEVGAWVHNCFGARYDDLTEAEQLHFQKFVDKGRDRGVELPWSGSNKQGSLEHANEVIRVVKENAQSVTPGKNYGAMGQGKVPTTTWKYRTQAGDVFWYTEEKATGTPLSIGRR